MSFIKEFWEFLKVRKKYWLLPIIIVLFIFGGLIVLTQGSAVAPFIYTIFKVSSILGISAFYHDSAACILINGKIIAAAQEERFTRIKHDPNYPHHSIEFVLKYANLKLSEVDKIVFFEKPFLKFERLLETYVAFAPKGFISFVKAMPLWIKEKLFQKNLLFNKLKKHDPSYNSDENIFFPITI